VLTDHSDDLDRYTYDELLSEIAEFNRCHEFEFVPGIEMSCGVAHIILIDAPEHPMTTDWREVVEFGRSRGVVSVLAHPVRSTDFVTTSEILTYVDGVEVWNTREDGRLCPDLRRIGLISSAISDNHLLFFGADFHGRGDYVENWIRVEPGSPDEKLSDILSAGAFRNVNEAAQLCLSSRSEDVIEEMAVPQSVVKRADRHRSLRRGLRLGAGVFRNLGLRIPRRISHAIKRRL
jgi:hypothetical protein